jgi:hypothetical protein
VVTRVACSTTTDVGNRVDGAAAVERVVNLK